MSKTLRTLAVVFFPVTAVIYLYLILGQILIAGLDYILRQASA